MMKIEINEKGPIGYYDEITYIKENYSKVLEHPERSAKTETSYVMVRVIGFLLVVLVAIYLYLTTKDIIYGIMAIVMVIAEVAILLSLFAGIKKIRSLRDEDGNRTIEVDDEGIRCIEKDKVTSLTWDEIQCIAINKRSVSVLPRETVKYGIYVPVKYKDELTQAIRSTGHFYKIEDNVNVR